MKLPPPARPARHRAFLRCREGRVGGGGRYSSTAQARPCRSLAPAHARDRDCAPAVAAVLAAVDSTTPQSDDTIAGLTLQINNEVRRAASGSAAMNQKDVEKMRELAAGLLHDIAKTESCKTKLPPTKSQEIRAAKMSMEQLQGNLKAQQGRLSQSARAAARAAAAADSESSVAERGGWNKAHTRNVQEEYCYCRSNKQEPCVQCDKCRDWFHLSCIKDCARPASFLPFVTRFQITCKNCQPDGIEKFNVYTTPTCAPPPAPPHTPRPPSTQYERRSNGTWKHA